MSSRALATLLFAVALPLQAGAAAPLAPRTQAEIDHLLDYIAHSDCRFYRNGSWHGMEEARSHVSTKLEYLRERGQVDSAEAFIEKAASRSSLSGKPYQVECAGMPALASEDWLKAELDRWRRAKS
jgi:hypothetical protein